MSDFFSPINGRKEREELLLTQPEVEVTEIEIASNFSIHCTGESLVKREISGILADDIRKRFGVTDTTPVFISELEADAQIGDEEWEHFHELLIECGDHKMDFETLSESNNFAQMLTWLEQDPDSK